jgi:hypothetical protein
MLEQRLVIASFSVTSARSNMKAGRADHPESGNVRFISLQDTHHSAVKSSITSCPAPRLLARSGRDRSISRN